MKIKYLFPLVAALGIFAQTGAKAQTTNPATPLERQLQQMQQAIQTKVDAGKRAEADYLDEFKTLDALIAERKATNILEAAQLTYLKAALYLEVIQDDDKGAAVMGQVVSNYPGTIYVANAKKVVEQVAKMDAAKKIQESLVAGAAFPDFNTTNTAGSPISVAALKGKVVLLDFWATWCPPCRAELPNVIATYKKYHSQGFEIIGVSLDDHNDALQAFLKQQEGMTWPQYFDGQRWSNSLAVKYGVMGIPFALLIGPDGKIIGRDLRGDDLGKAVAKAVAALK